MKATRAFLLPLLSLAAGCLFGQPSSGILTPVRAYDWSNAGVPGGVPSGAWPNCTTSACNTLFGGTVTAASINAAIASAPANTVVRVPAGTYTMSTAIKFNPGNAVALRGAGANQTFLDFSSASFSYPNSCQGMFAAICFQSSDVNYNGGPSNTANWTAGYSLGPGPSPFRAQLTCR